MTKVGEIAQHIYTENLDYKSQMMVNPTLKRLVDENKRIHKEAEKIFKIMDRLFINGLDYSLSVRDDYSICINPQFHMSDEYRALLNMYRELCDQSQKIVEKIDAILGYDDRAYLNELRKKEMEKGVGNLHTIRIDVE